jgi:excisionase family DNA binding protein
MKALKSVEESAELLGLSVWTVRAYIRDAKLRPVRIGRRVLLEESELERFVAQRKMGEIVEYREDVADSIQVPGQIAKTSPESHAV